MKLHFVTTLVCFFASQAASAELQCPVSAKSDVERIGQEGFFVQYTQEQMSLYQYSVIIRDNGDEGSEVGRCSYQTSAGRVTCDFYDVDYVSRDIFTDHRKFYYFSGQFDVQVFGSGKFVENNGRGTFAYGDCVAIN